MTFKSGHTIFPLEHGVDVIPDAGKHAHVSGIIELHIINRFVEPAGEKKELNSENTVYSILAGDKIKT